VAYWHWGLRHERESAAGGRRGWRNFYVSEEWGERPHVIPHKHVLRSLCSASLPCIRRSPRPIYNTAYTRFSRAQLATSRSILND